MKGVLTHTLAAVLGLIIGAVIGSSTADDSDGQSTTPTPTATVTATETQTETEAAPPPTPTQTEQPTQGSANEIPGDGTFLVGEEIEPGTYRTAGPADSAIPNCYWARLSGASGELDELIANGNTAGPATVTIASGDQAFQTTGCRPGRRPADQQHSTE
ncbi:hypothetical protein [Streptomyces sp. DG1A-41]|uniref:hypothetical protein n=1 Tax=Streptomyces sp. DG1A-41 TaxID=3125779 RepID=UPI0030D43507